MQFLFVSDFLPERASGAAGTLFRLAESLRSAGHPVDLVWRPDGLPGGGTAADRHLRLAHRQHRQLSTALATRQYDVVIVSQPWGWRAMERLPSRYPGTLFLNRTHGWEAREYDLERRLRWEAPRSPLRWMSSRAGALLAAYACRRMARAAQGVIAPASPDAHFVRTRYALPAESVAVIPYGADALPPVRAARADTLRMLFVGSLIQRKGSQVLARILPGVATRHPEVGLTFVTRIEAHSAIDRHYRAAFGERLRILPWLTGSALAAEYAGHDVVLFPSFFEGFGKVWLEGMAAGCCVVGFAEGGLADTPGSVAHTCTPGDVGGFTRALEATLKDPEGMRHTGAAAAAFAGTLRWERTALQTVAYCEQRRAALGMS